MSFLCSFSFKYIGKRNVASLFRMQQANFASTFYSTETKPEPLSKTDEQTLLNRSWATYPFSKDQDLNVPIYKLTDGEYCGESVKLDHEFFNLPLRRDLIHNVFDYHRKFGWKTFKTALRKGTVAGSGRKPAPQKGRGKARQGNLRSPINRGGGKAHGPVPRDLTIDIPYKVLLKGLKT